MWLVYDLPNYRFMGVTLLSCSQSLFHCLIRVLTHIDMDIMLSLKSILILPSHTSLSILLSTGKQSLPHLQTNMINQCPFSQRARARRSASAVVVGGLLGLFGTFAWVEKVG